VAKKNKSKQLKQELELRQLLLQQDILEHGTRQFLDKLSGLHGTPMQIVMAERILASGEIGRMAVDNMKSGLIEKATNMETYFRSIGAVNGLKAISALMDNLDPIQPPSIAS